MAIYHFTVKIHGLSNGESAIACAAYRAGERLYDEELRQTSDYRNKKEVVYKEIMLCENAPAEYLDRGTLWNSVMKIEKSKDAQFAREFEMALPKEADRETQIRMLHDFFEPLVEEGMCVDFVIHDKGDGNPHCQSLVTMRPIREDGSWGIRNHLLVIPTSVCASETAVRIAALVPGAVAIPHQHGCCQVGDDYRQTVRTLAGRLNAPLIDMYAASFALVAQMGEEESRRLYMHFKPGIYPFFPNGSADDTHTREAGAAAYARIVADRLRSLGLV